FFGFGPGPGRNRHLWRDVLLDQPAHSGDRCAHGPGRARPGRAEANIPAGRPAHLVGNRTWSSARLLPDPVHDSAVVRSEADGSSDVCEHVALAGGGCAAGLLLARAPGGEGRSDGGAEIRMMSAA